MLTEDPPALSVVIPAYNESAAILETLDRVASALERAAPRHEILVVDDGSTDGLADLVKQRIGEDPRVRLLRFSRNFGHQPAVCAGLQAASGEYVAVIDADLQDPPELLPEMLEQARGGFDVVYGVRRSRKGRAHLRLGYWIYYRLLRLLSESHSILDAGDFCVMSRVAVDALNRLPERRRYVRGLRSWIGFRQTGFVYDRPDREIGDSKYGLLDLIRLARSGLITSSRVPLKLVGLFGAMVAAAGFAWAGWVLVARVWLGTAPTGFAAVMMAVLILGGAQLISIGVVGQYLSRALDQVERRPEFVLLETVNVGEGAAARLAAS